METWAIVKLWLKAIGEAILLWFGRIRSNQEKAKEIEETLKREEAAVEASKPATQEAVKELNKKLDAKDQAADAWGSKE